MDDANAIAKNHIVDSCLVSVRHLQSVVLHGIHMVHFVEYFLRSKDMSPVSVHKCFITFLIASNLERQVSDTLLVVTGVSF